MVGQGFHEPFSYREGHSAIIASGAVSTQVARMPWQSPVNKPGIIKKLAVTNRVFGQAGTVSIWDQDLSNTTPPTAGSAGGAIYSLEVGALAASGVGSKTTFYSENDLPEIQFIAGVAAQSSLPGVTVLAEIEYI
jgi:hypothetical protein